MPAVKNPAVVKIVAGGELARTSRTLAAGEAVSEDASELFPLESPADSDSSLAGSSASFEASLRSHSNTSP